MTSIIALALALGSPALRIALPDGANGPCRAEMFLTAVRERLAAWEVRAASDPRAVEAVAEVQQEQSGWSLTLQRAGQPPLYRALPAAGVDCVETASTAALIIERALAEIAWSGETVRIDPLLVPPQMVGMPINSTSAEIQLWMELGADAGTGFGSIRPGFSLATSARRGPYSLGLAVSAALPASAPVGADAAIGSYRGFTGALLIPLGREVALPSGALRIELAPGVAAARASASGPLLAQQRPTSAAVFCAAARIGYELQLPLRFALALRAEARLLPKPLAFSVEGYPGDFSSTRVVAGLAASISRQIF